MFTEQSTKQQRLSVAASKAASIGLNLLKTTLNSIVSIGISMAISWIIEGLTSLANKSKEAEEAFKESLSEFKESTDDLLESRKNVKDLTDSYAEIALSTDDLSSRKEDLLEIQDELNNSFDDEKGKIDLLTQSYGEVTKAILEKQNAENEKYVEENENKYKAAKNKLEDDSYEIKVDGPSFILHPDWSWDFLEDLLATLPTFTGDPNNPDNHFSGNFNLKGNISQVYEDLIKIRDYMENNHFDYVDYIKPIEEQIASLEQEISGCKDVIEEFEATKAKIAEYATISGNSDTANKIYDYQDQVKELYDKYRNAVESYDTAGATAASDKINEIRGEMEALAEDSPILQGIVADLFNSLDEQLESKGESISSSFDVIQTTFKSFKEEGLSDFKSSINEYTKAIETLSGGEDLSFDQVQALIALDDTLINKFQKTAEGWSISVDDLIASEKELQQEKINTIKLSMQAIEAAQKEAETQITLNNQKIEQDQNRVNTLKANYVEKDQNGVKWYSAKQITEMSELTSDIERLTAENNELTSNIESSQQTYDQWKIMLDEVAQSAQATANALKKQVIAAYNDMISEVNDRISEIEDERDNLLDAIGDIDKKLSEIDWDNTLDGISKTTDFSQQLDKALQAVNKDVDGMSKLDKLTDTYNKINKSLDEQIDKLEEERDEKIENIRIDGLSASEEEKRHKKVTDNLDREIESYEKLLDAKEKIIEDYDTAISAVTDYIDEQVDGINTQIDALNRQKEALQETNDEINRNLELEKAKNALASARNNKNTLVYRAGSKFRLEANQEDVATAEGNLRTLELEQQTEAIDKQIEALNNSIEAWNIYKESWTSISDSYEKDQNKIIASQILGSNWTERISVKDTFILQTTADKYVNTQMIINDSIQKKLDALNAELEAENMLNDRRNMLFDQEEERLNTFYDNKITTLNEKINGEGGLKEQLWNWYFYQLTLLQNESSNIRWQYDQQITDLQNYKTRLENELLDLEGKERDSWNRRLTNLNNKITEYQNALSRLSGLQAEGNSYNPSKLPKSQLVYKIVDTTNGKMIYDHLTKAQAINLVAALSVAQRTNKYSAISYYTIIRNNSGGSYATGGVNDYTGLAQMHGSPVHSEVVFNARDAKKLFDFIHSTKDIGKELTRQFIEDTRSMCKDTSVFSTNQGITININKVVSDNPINFVQQMNSYMRRVGLDGLNHR